MHRDHFDGDDGRREEMDAMGLRFRFRATSLPKSPSAEQIRQSEERRHRDAQIENEEDDFVLATYVEPPELPTKTTHKVFGAFLSLFFSRTRRDFCCCLSIIHKNNENDDVSPFRVCICIYIHI